MACARVLFFKMGLINHIQHADKRVFVRTKGVRTGAEEWKAQMQFEKGVPRKDEASVQADRIEGIPTATEVFHRTWIEQMETKLSRPMKGISNGVRQYARQFPTQTKKDYVYILHRWRPNPPYWEGSRASSRTGAPGWTPPPPRPESPRPHSPSSSPRPPFSPSSRPLPTWTPPSPPFEFAHGYSVCGTCGSSSSSSHALPLPLCALAPSTAPFSP